MGSRRAAHGKRAVKMHARYHMEQRRAQWHTERKVGLAMEGRSRIVRTEFIPSRKMLHVDPATAAIDWSYLRFTATRVSEQKN